MKFGHTFWRAIAKRLGMALLTLWGVSVITFMLLFMLPADPAQSIGGERSTPETLANIRVKYALDKPLYVQYGKFVSDLSRNELRSYRNDDKVLGAIWNRFPATLMLALAGLFARLIFSVPLGLWTANKPGSAFDRTVLFLCIIAISIPTFWLGRVLQHYMGYQWGLFAVGGNASLWNLPLPALTLGVGGALYARLLHANLLSVMSQNYIRAALARGLSENKVLTKHALKNALIPLVTILGLDFASLLSGLIFTEKIFGWPGIGSLAVDSVLNLDVPMIMGTVMFSALMVVVAGIIIDITYHLIDPRVKFD